jgi:VanZ family protein
VRSWERLLRWLPVLGWMALIFLLSAQPDLPHPASGWLDLLISSAAHVFLFGVLALLLGWTLGPGRRGLVVALALTALYALSDELHQAFVPGRHADPRDLVCDLAGAALALALLAWWRRRGTALEGDRAAG